MTAGAIGLVCTLILSYPLLVHPSRASFLYIWFAFICVPPADGIIVDVGAESDSNVSSATSTPNTKRSKSRLQTPESSLTTIVEEEDGLDGQGVKAETNDNSTAVSGQFVGRGDKDVLDNSLDFSLRSPVGPSDDEITCVYCVLVCCCPFCFANTRISQCCLSLAVEGLLVIVAVLLSDCQHDKNRRSEVHWLLFFTFCCSYGTPKEERVQAAIDGLSSAATLLLTLGHLAIVLTISYVPLSSPQLL